ncbi:hypothetical protein GeomeDRAFT_3318 [Geobacter metallireducens RCH3]|nr:glycosyltransferase [Geobacter grbiciae]EHP83989.1 hypothetical protein GeomeDRAFT_3318 [Geobacter metallireducens RCH3]MBT1075489.1 glycosyltransferase [Geobacter grbiciae]
MVIKKIIFTIVARNYYGLAQVLRQSIIKYNDDITFYAFIADGIPSDNRALFSADAIDVNVVMQHFVAPEKLQEMAFKYNLTEYCTAIKPFCFEYLFNQTDVDQIIYLDPDILVFSSLTPVFDCLQYASIVLTPHILFPSSLEGKRSDRGIMATGIYNLGFIGVCRSNTGFTFIRWWRQRLLDQCFIDSHDALFTDQKWADFIPGLFPSEDVCVLRHSGTNIAPWNFHEREVLITEEDSLVVRRRLDPNESLLLNNECKQEPIIFVHFSGFDYTLLCKGEAVQYNISGLSIYNDLQSLIDIYVASIQAQKETVLKFLGMTYGYESFQDGSLIISFHRRLYRSAVESGHNVGNPFSTDNHSFHSQLVKHKLLLNRAVVKKSDRSNKYNYPNLSDKLIIINRMMRVIRKIIGLENFLLLLRLMRPYSRAEAQLHNVYQNMNKL